MSRPLSRILIIAVVVTIPMAADTADCREGIHNGGFELGLDPMKQRPAHWIIGFPGDAPPGGGWDLVPSTTGGGRSLELRSESEAGFFVSQVIDLPAATMAGFELTIRATVEIPDAPMWTAIQLVAINPEAPVDPELGFSHHGFLQLTTTTPGRHELESTLVLTGPAELIAVVLLVAGDDVTSVFDDVSVTADVPRPTCGPPVNQTRLPTTGVPAYPIGLTNENPRNLSDRALADLTARLAESGSILNLFAHVRWNAIARLPILDGYERVIATSVAAERYDLRRMLTFDFTHADFAGIGDINPLPDGSPVGRLDDPGVREAYVDELVALAVATGASIVSVGIETDFFFEAHPDQWGAYRTMLCTARDRLRALDPTIHVTTYFTMEGLVQPDLSSNVAGQAAFRQLAPCFDSVGYSFYPVDGVRHLDDLLPGTFTAPASVAPGMPLIIPEFGYRTDGAYSESEQADYLRRAMEELAGTEVVAMVLYSLYDQTYFGADPLFQTWFRTIGVRHLDGKPKEAWRLLRHLRWLRAEPTPGGIFPAAECVTDPRSGDPTGRARP